MDKDWNLVLIAADINSYSFVFLLKLALFSTVEHFLDGLTELGIVLSNVLSNSYNIRFSELLMLKMVCIPSDTFLFLVIIWGKYSTISFKKITFWKSINWGSSSSLQNSRIYWISLSCSKNCYKASKNSQSYIYIWCLTPNLTEYGLSGTTLLFKVANLR